MKSLLIFVIKHTKISDLCFDYWLVNLSIIFSILSWRWKSLFTLFPRSNWLQCFLALFNIVAVELKLVWSIIGSIFVHAKSNNLTCYWNFHFSTVCSNSIGYPIISSFLSWFVLLWQKQLISLVCIYL